MINVGILGSNFGKTHAEIYIKTEGFNVKKIFGRNIVTLQYIKDELNISVTNRLNRYLSTFRDSPGMDHKDS